MTQPSQPAGRGPTTPEARLAGLLEDGERRLREVITKLKRDPGLIKANLGSTMTIMKNVYAVLQEDADSPDGALANGGGARMWGSMERQYGQVFDQSTVLANDFRRWDEISANGQKGLTVPEVDETWDRLVARRRAWLDRAAEFQKTCSKFYRSLS